MRYDFYCGVPILLLYGLDVSVVNFNSCAEVSNYPRADQTYMRLTFKRKLRRIAG